MGEFLLRNNLINSSVPKSNDIIFIRNNSTRPNPMFLIEENWYKNRILFEYN